GVRAGEGGVREDRPERPHGLCRPPDAVHEPAWRRRRHFRTFDGAPAGEAGRWGRMTSETIASQRYFEDVELGDEFEEHQQPTAEHVAEFLASGNGPRGGGEGGGRFSDNAEAKRQGLERPIVPGNMSAAMITRIVTNWMGPLGRIVSLDVSFRRPVLHGDSLRCLAVV